MKCPYCGADVTPNTKCEYCGSFVEREEKESNSKKEYSEILGEFISETAEHLAEGLRNASNNANYSSNANSTNNAKSYEETIKRVSSPENKRILKKLVITFSIIIIVPVICYLIFLFFALRSGFSFLEMYGTSIVSEEATTTYDLCSLTDQEAIVKEFDSDGSMVLTYEGRDYNTLLKDDSLLSWLNKHSHTLETVGVLFSTDNDGNVTSIAMLSDTFYVLRKENSNYIVRRSDQIFSTTSDVPLEVGNFYDGYFHYPDLNAHGVTSNSGNGFTFFDPKCEVKEMQTFKDPYTDDEYSLPMIYMDDKWFHCTQEIYDACAEGEIIPGDICVDTSMGVIYLEK